MINSRISSRLAAAALIMAGGWVTLVLLGFVAVHFAGVEDNSESLLARFALLGDSFGTVNSFLSSAAVLAAVVTLLAQSQQMKDQNEQFLSQQEQERKGLYRDKLETLVIALQAHAAIQVDNLPRNLTGYSPEWIEDHSQKVLISIRLCSTYINLYFPALQQALDGLNNVENQVTLAMINMQAEPENSGRHFSEIRIAIQNVGFYAAAFADGCIQYSRELIDNPECEFPAVDVPDVDQIKADYLGRLHHMVSSRPPQRT